MLGGRKAFHRGEEGREGGERDVERTKGGIGPRSIWGQQQRLLMHAIPRPEQWSQTRASSVLHLLNSGRRSKESWGHTESVTAICPAPTQDTPGKGTKMGQRDWLLPLRGGRAVGPKEFSPQKYFLTQGDSNGCSGLVGYSGGLFGSAVPRGTRAA